MKRIQQVYTFFFLLVLMACNGPELGTNNSWCIPAEEVFDGGPGKDGIPSVDRPEFTSVTEADKILDPSDLVIGIKIGTEIRAYPHPILDWHEIVNDEIEGRLVSINYCPLTGTGMAWNRMINGVETTFGVSGLLYNTNLIPYDRNTDSNWSQMRMEAVEGDLKGLHAETFATVETSWETWRQLYPDSKIMTRNTGFSRAYGQYPYGDYKSNHNRLLFPVDPMDDRLPAKTRVLAIKVSGELMTFNPELFEGDIQVLETELNGKAIVAAGSNSENIYVAFGRELEDGTMLEFSPLSKQLPAIMEDQEGNHWDLFGYAISGPREGQQLKVYPSLMGFFFAFGAFYPDHILME